MDSKVSTESTESQRLPEAFGDTRASLQTGKLKCKKTKWHTSHDIKNAPVEQQDFKVCHTSAARRCSVQLAGRRVPTAHSTLMKSLDDIGKRLCSQSQYTDPRWSSPTTSSIGYEHSSPPWQTVPGNTPLHVAVAKRQFMALVGMLDNPSAGLFTPNAEGNTPLHLASSIGDESAVTALLKAGCDETARNALGETAIFSAIRHRSLPATEALIAGHVPDELSPAASARALELLSTKNSLGASPILLAAFVGDLKILKFLLLKLPLNSLSAILAAKDNLKNSVLHAAAAGGDSDTVQFLIAQLREIAVGEGRAGAFNVSARNFNKWTPLHYAAANGHVEICQILKSAGAEVNALTDAQETPAGLAWINRQFESWKMVVYLGGSDGPNKSVSCDRRMVADQAKTTPQKPPVVAMPSSFDSANFDNRRISLNLDKLAALQKIKKWPGLNLSLKSTACNHS